MYKRPKFIIGEWYRPGELIERSAREKHNTLIGYEPGGIASLPIHDYFQKADSFGMGVAVQITPESIAYVQGAKPGNLTAWLLPDEPIGKVDAITIGQMAANARSVRGDVPVIMNMDGNGLDNTVPAVITMYIKAAKGSETDPEKTIISYDYYPINFGQGIEGIPFHAHLVGLLRGCGATSIMSILECGNIDVAEQDWVQAAPWKSKMRGPTPEEILAQLQLCVEELHVEHITYFPDDIGKGWKGFTDVTPEASATVANVNEQLAIFKNGEAWPLKEPAAH